MATELCSYGLIVQHQKLLAIYSGWIGQKVCFLTHSAVTCDQADSWYAAATEVDRLVLVCHEAEKVKLLDLSGDMQAALGRLIRRYAAGGWWTSSDGTRERMVRHQERGEWDQSSEDGVEPDEMTFSPRLALEPSPLYSVAPAVMVALDAAVTQAAVAVGDLDACRLGTLLSGFCYRVTPRLHVEFINSVLNDLAVHDLTDLEAENSFRRAAGLSEVSEDRLPRSITDPAPVLPPPTLEDIPTGHETGSTFEPYIGDMTDQRDLILACVFRRFGVVIPPAKSDAAIHPELASMKAKLRASTGKAERSRRKTAPAEQTEFWAEEAIEYLGLDRLGLKRPDMALQRLIKKGSLEPTKIGGRNVFKRENLDRVRAKGDQSRRRGRPRKNR